MFYAIEDPTSTEKYKFMWQEYTPPRIVSALPKLLNHAPFSYVPNISINWSVVQDKIWES